MKVCSGCKQTLPLTNFGFNSGSGKYKDRKYHKAYCKPCETERVKEWRKLGKRDTKTESAKWRENNRAKYNAQRAKERAGKRQATPAWADDKEIEYIYTVAHERNLTVDHIVPLNSKAVCGLHCEDNMRCITQQLNTKKLNRYWPDMWPKEY